MNTLFRLLLLFLIGFGVVDPLASYRVVAQVPDPISLENDAVWEDPFATDRGSIEIPRPGEDAAQAESTTSQVAPTGRDGWLRTLMALLMVVGLILILAWGYRAVNQGLARTNLRGHQAYLLEVVARSALSPKHGLALVRVGPRLVLLGLSPERISRVGQLTQEESAQMLGAEHGRRRSDEDESFDEPLAQAEAAFETDERLARDESDWHPDWRAAPTSPTQHLQQSVGRVRGALGRLLGTGRA